MSFEDETELLMQIRGAFSLGFKSCAMSTSPPPRPLSLPEPYLQRTNWACLRGNTACLTGCFCQGATKWPLSPLCAIMLIVDSKAFVAGNECKPIVPALGPLESKYAAYSVTHRKDSLTRLRVSH